MKPAKRQFEEEAREVFPALNRAAMVLCHHHSDVDDVVQETLVRAHKAFTSFRRDSSFFSWAYRILMRVASSANKKRSSDAQEGDGPIPVDDYSAADAVMMRNETTELVLLAIRALPDRQREVATLYFMQEMSYADVAEAMNISIGTVKATLFAAKKTLRSELINHGYQIVKTTKNELSK